MERAMVKTPERVTIALDEETTNLLRDMKDDLRISQSELMREALKFYSRHKALFDSIDEEKIYTYVEMLSAGEHVILDIDHWILFLNLIESHPHKDEFWAMHRSVSQSHAEEFRRKNYEPEVVLNRLEACNLFKMSKTSETDFTLLLGYDVPKKFVKTELEDIFSKMGIRAEIKEDFSKLRVKILP
jgi:Ribbon-helix-helix protein, copG family.